MGVIISLSQAEERERETSSDVEAIRPVYEVPKPRAPKTGREVRFTTKFSNNISRPKRQPTRNRIKFGHPISEPQNVSKYQRD